MNRTPIAILLVGLAIALTGCGPKQVAYGPAAAYETYTVRAPHAVFAGNARPDASDEQPAARPWYASRNDARLSHRPGGANASVTAFVTRIYDRQTSHDGDVRNRYHRTHRSAEFGSYVD